MFARKVDDFGMMITVRVAENGYMVEKRVGESVMTRICINFNSVIETLREWTEGGRCGE